MAKPVKKTRKKKAAAAKTAATHVKAANKKPAPKKRRLFRMRKPSTYNPFILLWRFISSIGRFIKKQIAKLQASMKAFMQRRPHRSFRPTRRRDYVRSFRLPGYFSFTIEVTKLLWHNRKIFIWMGLVYLVLIVVFGIMGSQEIYGQLRELMTKTAPDSLFSGAVGEVSKAGVLLFATVTTGITGKLEPLQLVIAAFLSLYVWLTTVWLLRRIVAGKKVKLRDGLYNAGAPILPTLLIFIVLLVQLVPAAAVVIVSGAAWQSGFVSGGAESMALGIGLLLVFIASLYWMVSTFIATIVATLPGMYPMQALAIAGDLVIGRRLRVLYRMVWMLLVVLSWWVVVMIPIILFDGWIKSVFTQIEWLPIVPAVLLVISTASIIWSCTYTYLLYRKMVDDDTSPA